MRVCIVVQYVSIIHVIFINFRQVNKMKNSINNIFQTTYFLSSQLQYTSKYIQDVILSIEYYFLIINLCKSSKILLASISTKCVENHCSEKPPIKLSCMNITFYGEIYLDIAKGVLQ